jgi:hypothetical protein
VRFVRTNRSHAAALRAFACAGDAWYEQEVERYVRGTLADAVAHGQRILALQVGSEIAAVASHDPVPDPGGSGLTISWLTVAAIRTDFQGTRLATGDRLPEVLVAALVHDALRTDRSPVLAGLVAEENVRSRRMCAKAGLMEDPLSRLASWRVGGASMSSSAVLSRGRPARRPGWRLREARLLRHPVHRSAGGPGGSVIWRDQ